MSDQSGSNFPLFQVWHPTTLNSSTYNKAGEVQLPQGSRINGQGQNSYYHASLSLNSNSQIEFQLGDVIGYYQPSSPSRLIWSIQTSGYISYSNAVTNPLASIDTNALENVENDRQPLIAIMFGKITKIMNMSANHKFVALSLT